MFLPGPKGYWYNLFTWGIVWQLDQPESAVSEHEFVSLV